MAKSIKLHAAIVLSAGATSFFHSCINACLTGFSIVKWH